MGCPADNCIGCVLPGAECNPVSKVSEVRCFTMRIIQITITALTLCVFLACTAFCDAIAPPLDTVSSEIKGILPFVVLGVIAVTIVIARKLKDRK